MNYSRVASRLLSAQMPSIAKLRESLKHVCCQNF